VDKKVIDTARGKALADQYGIKFLETSAKNSINVDEAFITLARDIKKRLIDTAEQQAAADANSNGKVNLNNKNPQGQKGAPKKKCCS
jgi:Ras-related protein Rab-8A